MNGLEPPATKKRKVGGRKRRGKGSRARGGAGSAPGMHVVVSGHTVANLVEISTS